MPLQNPIGWQTVTPSEGNIGAKTQEAENATRAEKTATQRALEQSNERIEALEQKARDLACFVETTRQQTLLQSDKKTETLEQNARDLADFVETLRNQTRLHSEAETEALAQKARDLANSVEAVRKDTRLRSEREIAALGKQARDLAISVETVREETLLNSETEIKGLKQEARNLAFTVEKSRIQTLMESDKLIRKLNTELEQRVLERTGQLEAANKELESFSYSVSHDLRAPLRAIDGFSRILLEDFAAPLPEECKAYLNRIRDNTRQMAQLVDDLLAFSRLGRLGLAKQTLDTEKIVRLCLSEMRTEQRGRQIEIDIGALPNCQGDLTLLKQVWTNLLSNALKYTRKREIARITIGHRTIPRPLISASPNLLSVPEEEAVYFIQDNGAGFDMKYAHKLFGVFQRLHRAADYDGTGVGLAIVQRIISRHGGRVWGEAQLNVGATFFFTLE